MIGVGDIVERGPVLCSASTPNMSSYMFFSGYFIVIDVTSDCTQSKIMTACNIMNEFGHTSWISSYDLKLVISLEENSGR